MTTRTIALLVLFVVFTWAGAAGIAYGVVQGVEGPQGESGLQGEQGERGPRGRAGEAAAEFEFDVGSGFHPLDLRFSTERLARMFAATEIGEGTTHPQTQACIDYIMDNEGSFVECGYSRTE